MRTVKNQITRTCQKDLYYFLFMATAIVLGQSRTREIGLITENDLYTSLRTISITPMDGDFIALTKNDDDKVNKKDCRN
jgi:hypothetical protein